VHVVDKIVHITRNRRTGAVMLARTFDVNRLPDLFDNWSPSLYSGTLRFRPEEDW
jgi:hypothetical protein